MRTLTRLAGIGAGAAMLIGGAAAGASAATPPTKAAAAHPSQLNCTFTITHPTVVYKHASFARGHFSGGKHTGQVVTSDAICRYFIKGFHRVRLAGGGTGWIYAANLGKPSPRPEWISSYRVTGTVNVRSGPSTSHGAIIGVKTKGQVVKSPDYKDGIFLNNGFAEVLMGNGNIGWISSKYVK